MLGHTKCYVPVLLPLDKDLLGKNVTVTITAAGKHFVRGMVCGTGAR
jgi:hypothetical protein